jgi:hypothetical protein
VRAYFDGTPGSSRIACHNSDLVAEIDTKEQAKRREAGIVRLGRFFILACATTTEVIGVGLKLS